MDHVDEYGYTALDYTVFAMNVDMEEVVIIEGLRDTLKGDIECQKSSKRQYEARLKKMLP